MNNIQFKEVLAVLQNTKALAENAEGRKKAYDDFNTIFNHLATETWSEDYLVERHEYDERAVFQNVAEAYFRLGYVETIFFQYSKLVYELWYKKTVELQKQLKRRVHKGTQLHQIASIHELFGNNDKAWTYYLAGFVEDVLEGRRYVDHQGYRSLRRFGISLSNLEVFANKTKRIKGEATYDPLRIVEMFQQKSIIPTYQENITIDLIKLEQAKDLWAKLNEAKSNGK